MAYAGITTLVLLIPLELLKYPKLCRGYFSLLALLLEVKPLAGLLMAGSLRQGASTVVGGSSSP